jgi:hypothetical protein
MRAMWQRALLAIGVGLTVTSVALVADWCRYRQEIGAYDQQGPTRQRLDDAQLCVERYHRLHDRWPSSFEELASTPECASPTEDQWRNPLRLEMRDRSMVVVSLGRDGKPGGAGIDADLVSGELHSIRPLTLNEFLIDQPAGGMTDTCALAGALAFVLTLYLSWNPHSRTVAIQLALCTAFAVFAAVVMSALHLPHEIPEGH